MEPLASIIVPVYNGQDYLENCIRSIQGQTYQNKEIILINDGSTDRTEEVCRKLARKYANIQAVLMNDEGVSAARNAGIDRAGGDYLMFVDADDVLHPKMLQILYDALVKTDSDAAGCGFFSWSNEEELQCGIQAKKSAADGLHIFQKKELLAQVAEGKDTRCWAKLYKRNVIGNHRFRQGLTIGEDMLFLLDILPDIRKMTSVEFQGYGYYQNPAGAMNRKFTSAYMDQITCWEIAKDLVTKMDDSMAAQVTEKLLMAIMLVAGKLAFLPASERGQQQENIQVCVRKLKDNLQVEGAYGRLSKGYKVKTKLFVNAPGFYLGFYHFRKYLRW